MNKGVFSKLAIDGIRKNSKLYIPYIISFLGVASIYFLLTYLVKSPALNVMGGGTNMRAMLALGKIVMVVFIVIFLFYTSTFLNKRRNKEYALYNILGMNKRNVIRVLLFETLFLTVIGIVAGIGLGVVLSKLFEMMLLKLCGYTPDNVIYFSGSAIVETIVVFVAFQFVLFVWTCLKMSVSSPIELLRSSKTGEKPPKANWVLAIIGLGGLVYAYYLAISIKDPVSAINVFFIAVIIVIVSTYCIFIAGSVALCKVLKNNRNFYYNPKHFVPVSGMLYRMKRNGAGLATICILSTMVLVIVSSVFSLYIGSNNSIETMFPTSLSVTVRVDNYKYFDSEEVKNIQKNAEEILAQYNDTLDVAERTITLYANSEKNRISVIKAGERMPAFDDKSTMVIITSLEDYNKCGHDEQLNEGEILLHTVNNRKTDEIVLDGKEYKVVGKADKNVFPVATNIVKYYCVVTADFDSLAQYYEIEAGNNCLLQYICFSDNKLSDNINIEISNKMYEAFQDFGNVSAESKAEYRQAFMELYGSLVMLGFFLTVTFLGACVLIIYYKQISEGYEDADSFEIMQKVGMTKEEIEMGINSQMLVTFFTPLAMAGLHLMFSFPMVQKILRIFGIGNGVLLIVVYLSCYLLFSGLYYLVHKKTVKAYVDIVY